MAVVAGPPRTGAAIFVVLVAAGALAFIALGKSLAPLGKVMLAGALDERFCAVAQLSSPGRTETAW